MLLKIAITTIDYPTNHVLLSQSGSHNIGLSLKTTTPPFFLQSTTQTFPTSSALYTALYTGVPSSLFSLSLGLSLGLSLSPSFLVTCLLSAAFLGSYMACAGRSLKQKYCKPLETSDRTSLCKIFPKHKRLPNLLACQDLSTDSKVI